MTINYPWKLEIIYQLDVIDRLQSMKKISKTKADLLKVLVIGWNITKIFGLNYKLISKKNQYWIITIAHKVKWSQYSILW